MDMLRKVKHIFLFFFNNSHQEFLRVLVVSIMKIIRELILIFKYLTHNQISQTFNRSIQPLSEDLNSASQILNLNAISQDTK